VEPSGTPAAAAVVVAASASAPVVEEVSVPEVVPPQVSAADSRGPDDTAAKEKMIRSLKREYAALKKELRNWEKEFQQREGREPSSADKQAVKEKYMEYAVGCVSDLVSSLFRLKRRKQELAELTGGDGDQ